MSKLIELIKAYWPKLLSHKDSDDAFLKKSVDIYELEHRMEAISRRSSGDWEPPYIAGMEGR